MAMDPCTGSKIDSRSRYSRQRARADGGHVDEENYLRSKVSCRSGAGGSTHVNFLLSAPTPLRAKGTAEGAGGTYSNINGWMGGRMDELMN